MRFAGDIFNSTKNNPIREHGTWGLGSFVNKGGLAGWGARDVLKSDKAEGFLENPQRGILGAATGWF